MKRLPIRLQRTLSLWVLSRASVPTTQPQQGLSQEGFHVLSLRPRVTGPLLHSFLEAWHHHPTPICWPHPPGLPSTLQGGLPVRRPSQAQAGLWFISAAPAASLKRPRKQGQLVGMKEGAALGHVWR